MSWRKLNSLFPFLVINIIIGVLVYFGILLFHSLNAEPPSEIADRKLSLVDIGTTHAHINYSLMITVHTAYKAIMHYQMKCNNDTELYIIGVQHQYRQVGKYSITYPLEVPVSVIDNECEFIAGVTTILPYTLWSNTVWGNKMWFKLSKSGKLEYSAGYGWNK